MRRRRIRATIAMAILLLTTTSLAGCARYDDLLFRQDHRLTFTAPPSYEQVELPVTVSWTMTDFEVLPPDSDAEPSEQAGYFAVFVDQAPVKPGHTLDDVADDDPACERAPRCPDRRYLNSKGVYPTRQTTLTLESVLPLSSREDVHLHEVTVILLDSEGRRIGEYAWYRRFKLENVLAR